MQKSQLYTICSIEYISTCIQLSYIIRLTWTENIIKLYNTQLERERERTVVLSHLDEDTCTIKGCFVGKDLVLMRSQNTATKKEFPPNKWYFVSHTISIKQSVIWKNIYHYNYGILRKAAHIIRGRHVQHHKQS